MNRQPGGFGEGGSPLCDLGSNKVRAGLHIYGNCDYEMALVASVRATFVFPSIDWEAEVAHEPDATAVALNDALAFGSWYSRGSMFVSSFFNLPEVRPQEYVPSSRTPRYTLACKRASFPTYR